MKRAGIPELASIQRCNPVEYFMDGRKKRKRKGDTRTGERGWEMKNVFNVRNVGEYGKNLFNERGARDVTRSNYSLNVS